jgi:hypothetical protein
MSDSPPEKKYTRRTNNSRDACQPHKKGKENDRHFKDAWDIDQSIRVQVAQNPALAWLLGDRTCPQN